MSEMSRQIRHELERHGSTLKDVPRKALEEYVEIIGAFLADLREELDRRNLEPDPRLAASAGATLEQPYVITKERAEEALRAAAFFDDTSGRTIIHSFAHSGVVAIGADFDLDSALELVAAAEEIAWIDHPIGHDLAVRTPDRIVYFACHHPARTENT